jgi:hypothetical protein
MTRIKYLTDLLKKYEFCKLMAGYPIIRHLLDWRIDGKYFKVDMEGLAAHYGFATAMIDLSRSKDVAMFFALCENIKGRYEPIVDESREVVLYTINLKALMESNSSDVHVIGFQALPRPDAQKAYSLWLGPRQNLNECHFVSKEMLKVRRIDREVLEACFDRHWIPKVWDNLDELTKFLRRHGYLVREKQLEFSDEARREIVENWNSNPPLSSDRVKCRFVAEPA